MEIEVCDELLVVIYHDKGTVEVAEWIDDIDSDDDMLGEDIIDYEYLLRLYVIHDVLMHIEVMVDYDNIGDEHEVIDEI